MYFIGILRAYYVESHCIKHSDREEGFVTEEIHCSRGVFSTGAMGALAPAILKNWLLADAIFGHYSTEGKIAGAK